MSEGDRYERALAFATAKHAGQFRIGGLPYITHPVAVAEELRKRGYGIAFQIAGLFHDLLEDTDATEQEIEALGSPEVLDAVKRLTKQKGYVMAAYIASIKASPMAKAVKTADRLHNLRCATVADVDFRRRYILESIDWYLDFDPEIPKAVKALADTLDAPIRTLSLDYQPVSPAELRTDSFALKGDICHATELGTLDTLENGYLVCVDGKSCGLFSTLPAEYRNLPVYEYSGKLIIPGSVDLQGICARIVSGEIVFDRLNQKGGGV